MKVFQNPALKYIKEILEIIQLDFSYFFIIFLSNNID